MSEVSLSIGGRSYRVACAQGEEDRVTRLGGLVAEKLASMGSLSNNEAQNLLFAALLLADEVHEGQPTAEARALAEAELAQLREAQNAATEAIERASVRIAELTEALAAAETRCGALEDENAALRERQIDGSTAPGGASEASEAELAPALERLAEMLEDCADKLESTAQGS